MSKKASRPASGALRPSATFRGGHGLSPYHVDCSANPMDLRPAADMIMKRIDEILPDATPEKPLVVLMGEIHGVLSHNVLQQLVMERLCNRKEKFVAALEWPHNLLTVVMKDGLNLHVPKSLTYKTGDYDTDGKAVLSGCLGFEEPVYLKAAIQNQRALCLEKNILTCFNDVARRYSFFDTFYMDLNDPAVRCESEKAGLVSKDCGTKIFEIVAVTIRNSQMAKRGHSYALRNEARIVMQMTGRAHVLGYRPRGASYEDSLCAQYRRAGAEVLPVFIEMGQEEGAVRDMISVEAYDELPKSVIISGLPRQNFSSDHYIHEKIFFSEMCRQSGNEISLIDTDEKQYEYKKLARTYAEDILRRALG